MIVIDHQEHSLYIQDGMYIQNGIKLPINIISDAIKGYQEFINMNNGGFIDDNDASIYILGYLVSKGNKSININTILSILDFDYYFLQSKGLIGQ